MCPHVRRHAFVAGGAETAEGDAAQAANHAERRQRRLDQRESQFGVQEERLVAEELEVVVATQFGVAAEVHVAREFAPALEPAGAERQHAVGGEPQVVARVDVDGLARQKAARADGAYS